MTTGDTNEAASVRTAEAQPGSAPSSGSTDPATLPDDVKKKILRARDALLLDDRPEAIRQAWHELYAIADPNFDQYDPWANLEGR